MSTSLSRGHLKITLVNTVYFERLRISVYTSRCNNEFERLADDIRNIGSRIEASGLGLVMNPLGLSSARTSYGSSGASFQPVFVMQTTQDVLNSDLAVAWQEMPLWLGPRNRSIGARSGFLDLNLSVGVLYYSESDPGSQASPQVSLIQRDYEIQTFPSHGPDESFAISVACGARTGVRKTRSPKASLIPCPNPTRRSSPGRGARTYRMIARNRLPQLLEGPVGVG